MLTPGTRIGPYEIVNSLGTGGMGTVYRARDPRVGRDVAIKALPDALASDAGLVARFEREAQILASLNHPHIAALHGLEEVGGSRFLILELVEGDDLSRLIATRADAAAGGVEARAPDCGCASRGARAGHRAPRSQTSQRRADA